MDCVYTTLKQYVRRLGNFLVVAGARQQRLNMAKISYRYSRASPTSTVKLHNMEDEYGSICEFVATTFTRKYDGLLLFFDVEQLLVVSIFLCLIFVTAGY